MHNLRLFIINLDFKIESIHFLFVYKYHDSYINLFDYNSRTN